MKCGDIVRNHWASENNPTRYFIYVRNEGKYARVIYFDGERITANRFYSADLKEQTDKYVVVGHINLIDFLKAPLMKLLDDDNTDSAE